MIKQKSRLHIVWHNTEKFRKILNLHWKVIRANKWIVVKAKVLSWHHKCASNPPLSSFENKCFQLLSFSSFKRFLIGIFFYCQISPQIIRFQEMFKGNLEWEEIGEMFLNRLRLMSHFKHVCINYIRCICNHSFHCHELRGLHHFTLTVYFYFLPIRGHETSRKMLM